GFSVPEDVPTVDQAEARGLVLSASLDVGPDGGAFEPVEGGDQLLIGTPVVVSVRGHQQVICLDVKRPVRLVPGVHLGNKLANAIDKYILVMDRSQAKRARNDRYFDAVVLVLTDGQIGLSCERINGMFHRSHVVLGNRVGYVANEEILDRITIRQERRLFFR